MFNDTTLDASDGDLSEYDFSKSAIRFQPDKSLPFALVHKLTKTHLVENAAAGKKD